MRSYSVAIASLAIGAPLRWTDNLLAQHAVPEVLHARRGVARRIPHGALLRLAVVRSLHVELGIPVARALEVAAGLLPPAPFEGQSPVQRVGQIELALDREALARVVEARLRDALESAPAPRRGRPPGRTKAGAP